MPSSLHGFRLGVVEPYCRFQADHIQNVKVDGHMGGGKC
jgi:hypothetical protein